MTTGTGYIEYICPNKISRTTYSHTESLKKRTQKFSAFQKLIQLHEIEIRTFRVQRKNKSKNCYSAISPNDLRSRSVSQ